MKVLIIDDDEISRLLMTETLEGAGHKVLELPSPIGATGLILKENIDVVVIDVMMPSMNGDKLAKLLKGNRQLRAVGIVLVSSSEDGRMDGLAESVGALAFVGKSQIRTSLASAVQRSVARSRVSENPH